MSTIKRFRIFLGIVVIIVISTAAWAQRDQNVKVSLKEASKMVIDKIAKPSKAPYGLRVHRYPDLLPTGSTIVPYHQWIKGEQDFIVCDGESWFFWFDDNPLAQFAHETRYVIVNAVTGKMTVKEARWWPVVRGKVMWGETEKRAKDEFVIFQKPSPLKLPVDWKHDFKFGEPQAIPGCEEWVILICGSTDIGNTFDEDVQFLYNVFTGLGYNDDHIFYISPWTSDPGVDQTTNIANVQWAINQVMINSDAEDKVFFFYSSHGDVDTLHCCPDQPGGGSVTSTDMDNWLDTINAREMTIMLQGCHTGSFIGYYSDGTVVASENELTGDGETNRIAITATDTNHSSYGGSSTWGSTFTGGYVESFNDPAADVDTSSSISVNEAYTYALDHDSAATAGLSFPHMDPGSLDPGNVFHVCPLVDVWISDGPGDSGNNSYDYDSTDIWSSLSSTGTTHTDPVSGMWNYVHVRVHNLGASAANDVDVTLYWADTSTALAWPGDFTQIGTTFTIPSIPAGGDEEHTWSWYVSPSFGLGHQFCFVATADCSSDPMVGGPPGYTYVAPYDNNIAQKNITIVETESGQFAQTWFFIKNNSVKMIPFDLVIKKVKFPEGELILSIPNDLAIPLKQRNNLLKGLEFADSSMRESSELRIKDSKRGTIQQIQLKPMERRKVSLKIIPPQKAKIGQEFKIKVEEVARGEVIGANTFLIRIVPPGDCRVTMKRAVEVFALIAHKYESNAAFRLVKVIRDGLVNEICRDHKATLNWKRTIFKLETEIGKELQKQTPGELLKAYFISLEKLKTALDAGDLNKVIIAQAALVKAAAKLIANKQ